VKLRALYKFDPFTGLWHHRDARSRPPVSLYDISYASGAMEFRAQRATPPERVLAELQDPVLPASFERIRWFPLLREAQRELAALGRNSQ
jgi:hypothetical protein